MGKVPVSSPGKLSYARRKYREQRGKGLCGYGTCPQPATEGRSMCASHLRLTGGAIRRLLDGRVAQGLCRRCGAPYFTRPFCLPCRAGHGLSPLPPATRKQIRQFWRDDEIKERRCLAREVIQSSSDERLKQILTMRHGLADGLDAALEDIGAALGITRERVRQIEDLALFRLEQSGVDVSRLRFPFVRVSARGLSFAERELRDKARQLFASAIHAGTLKRQPCEKCGKKAQGHHTDYSKPYEVEWLCRPHHMEAHGKTMGKAKAKKRRKVYWGNALPKPDDATYSVKYLRTRLLAGRPSQTHLARAIGISKEALIAVLCGKKTYSRVLLRVLQYAESLNDNAQAKAA